MYNPKEIKKLEQKLTEYLRELKKFSKLVEKTKNEIFAKKTLPDLESKYLGKYFMTNHPLEIETVFKITKLTQNRMYCDAVLYNSKRVTFATETTLECDDYIPRNLLTEITKEEFLEHKRRAINSISQ